MFLLNCILGVCVFSSSWAQDANCDFQQNVEPGRTYYVNNLEYPRNYSRGAQCRWIGKCPTGYNCKLNCPDITLPQSQGCTMDRLLVSKTGDYQLNQAERYCGKGSLTAVSEKQTISVGLIAAQNSPGGRFACQLTAQAAQPDQNTCRCGYKKSNRIVGGVETGVNEFPMMAGLVEQNVATIKCGAVIISERYLTTAAHCVDRKDPAKWAVVVGEHDVTTGSDTPATQGLRVERFIVHPNWDPRTTDYDIALVLTAGDIVFSDRVGPVCLPFKFQRNNFAGETVTALGWGTTSFGGPDSTVLMKVDLQVISQSSCAATNPLFLSQRQMCTYTPMKDTCQDDSGGPLLYTDKATGLLFHIGTVSGGKLCATSAPAVSTRVTEFLDWIQSVTQYNFCKK